MFGVVDEFATVDTPRLTGFENTAGIGVQVTVGDKVVGAMVGFHDKETATKVIRVVQVSMSIVDEDEQAELAMEMLTMFARKTWQLPTPEVDEALVEQNYLDADTEQWQFGKVGVSL